MRFVSLLLLAGVLLGAVTAQTTQQRLVVNGVPVEGYAPDLVPGSAYAPAAPLARALGARYSLGRDAATFELGGTFLSIPVFESVAAAAEAPRPLLVNGRPLEAGEGGVRTENGVYVPVRAVSRALGGTVAYLAGENTVMVTFPRATLLTVTPPEPDAEARFTFRFSARVPVLEPPPATEPGTEARTLRLRFARTDLAPGVREGEWRGAGFEASLSAVGGGAEFTLTHTSEGRAAWFAAPQGGGFALVVDLVRAEGEDARAAPRAPLVVIDPGHGGEDRGLVFEAGSGGAPAGEGVEESESALTLAFGRRLAEALLERGIPSRLTREADTAPSLEGRAAAGVGADLFVSLHAAPLEGGRFNLYFLDEESANGVSSLRRAEAAGGDANSNFIPDFMAGERYARALREALSGTLAPQALEGAPIYVLGGAAGRGVMLELSPQDLASETLPILLADALVAALQNERALEEEGGE